MIIRSNKK